MEGDLAALQQAQIARICEIKQYWFAEREEIEPAVTGSDLHKNSQNALLRRLPILDAWAQSETQDLHVPSELEEFTQSGLLAKSKKGNPPQLALFERIEAFLAELCHSKHRFGACDSSLSSLVGESQIHSSLALV